MVPPRGVGGPAPIFALAIFWPFLIEPLLKKKKQKFGQFGSDARLKLIE